MPTMAASDRTRKLALNARTESRSKRCCSVSPAPCALMMRTAAKVSCRREVKSEFRCRATSDFTRIRGEYQRPHNTANSATLSAIAPRIGSNAVRKATPTAEAISNCNACTPVPTTAVTWALSW